MGKLTNIGWIGWFAILATFFIYASFILYSRKFFIRENRPGTRMNENPLLYRAPRFSLLSMPVLHCLSLFIRYHKLRISATISKRLPFLR